MSGDEWKTVALGLLTVVNALLAWWGNVVWTSLKELKTRQEADTETMRRAQSAQALHLAENYVRKDDLKERLQEVIGPLKDAINEVRDALRTR